MKYLGGIHGSGDLKSADETFARVDYDFDSFLRKPGEMIGSGEIRMRPDTMEQVFGRDDLHLMTDDGRHLRIRTSGQPRMRSPLQIPRWCGAPALADGQTANLGERALQRRDRRGGSAGANA